MFLLQSDELLDHARDIIHKETQHHKFSLDLTVTEIHQYIAPAALDFGGSEFEAASTELVEPQKLNIEDDYGWWQLQQGTYKAVFNEELQHLEDTLAVISPHNHADEAGIIAGTKLISSEAQTDRITLNFQTPSMGCRIKENARLATLHILAG